jgi:hypothetical protein
MELSDTIQARHQAARNASLFQQQPSALIDAVESREFDLALRQTGAIQSAGAIRTIIDARSIPPLVIGLTGALAGTVMLVDYDYPTGGPAVIEHETGVHRIKPEWASTTENTWVRWAETTKNLLRLAEPDLEPASSAAARLRVDRLAAIQASFGLPTQTIAEALGVSRQALYKWLDASKDIAMQGASRARFDTVEGLARAWRDRSVAPLSRAAHVPLDGGQTVIELLKAAVIDKAAVLAAFDELAAKLVGQPKSLSQKMVEAGFARRSARRSVPDDE